MKVGLLSLGCAKNQVDSEHMLYMLREMGHQIVSDEKDAQVIIINTCGFIDSAKEEAIDAILSAVQLKEEGLCQKVMVTGCLAQRYGESLMEEIPEIDGLIGVEQYQHFKQFMVIMHRNTPLFVMVFQISFIFRICPFITAFSIQPVHFSLRPFPFILLCLSFLPY